MQYSIYLWLFKNDKFAVELLEIMSPNDILHLKTEDPHYRWLWGSDSLAPPDVVFGTLKVKTINYLKVIWKNLVCCALLISHNSNCYATYYIYFMS